MDKNVLDKIENRLNIARKRLISAQKNYRIGDYDTTVNRTYYCVFACMRSVLLTEGKEFSSHKETMGAFRKFYIKTGIFDVSLSDDIRITFDSRERFDYDDDGECSEELATACLKAAEHFYEVVYRYLCAKYFSKDLFYTEKL